MTTKRLRDLLCLLRAGVALKSVSIVALTERGLLCPTCGAPTHRCRSWGLDHGVGSLGQCTCGWDDAREAKAAERREEISELLALRARRQRRDTRTPIERMIDAATGHTPVR